MALNSGKIRELFLQQRSEFYSFHQNVVSSTIVSRILQAEKIKSQFKHIKARINYNNYTQINKLKIPLNNGEWTTIDDDEKINKKSYNIRKIFSMISMDYL